MPLEPGTRIGPYEILSPLGSGGMGEVYLSRDPKLGREVAVKILPPEFSSNADRLLRFEQEARTASSLNHPNIITIYEIGSVDSCSFMAMEYIDGKTLRQHMQAGSIPIKKAIQIVTQVAEGLSKAHEAGIIHRDLKPENIMITRDGFAKILDFGLAKLNVTSAPRETSMLPTAAKTSAGIVLGTVGYMSPEQASASEIDFRSDQFSLGAILYEMVTGKRAFQKKTSVETLTAIINEGPPPVQSLNAQVPAPLRWIIDRCMEKNPQERYASTRDLARDLQSIRDHYSEIASSSETELGLAAAAPKKRSRKLRDIVAGALILLLAAALFYAVRRTPAVEQAAAKPVTYQRLTYRRGPVFSARFTPDGNTILYSAQWEGDPREIFVARPNGVDSRPIGVTGADVLSISPSGEMLILYIKQNGRNVLAQVSITGGTPRELAVGIRGADWTPDGSNMALARRSGGKTQLEFPPGTRLYETTLDIRYVRFSTNGERIAFMDRFDGSANGKVVVVDTKGKKIAESGPFYPLGLAWASPDEVWFSTLSNKQGGSIELHSMDMTGHTRYIAPVVWSELADISLSGGVLLPFSHQQTIALSVPGKDSTPRNITWLDQTEILAISKDGKKILAHERGEASEFPSGTIYMVNSDGTGGVRLAAGRPVEFSPDGKSVLSIVGNKEIRIVPVGAGDIQSFPPREGERIDYLQFMPDGKQLLLGVRDAHGKYTLQSHSLPSGDRKILSTLEVLPQMLSPDGKSMIAQASDLSFILFSWKDGATQPLKGINPIEEPLQWSSDGKSYYVFTRQQVPCPIFKIDVATGKRTLFQQFSPADPAGVRGISSFAVSTDEKTYAYSYQTSLSSLYLVQGLR